MKILTIIYKRETGKSALLRNIFGKHIGYTKEYVSWLEKRNDTYRLQQQLFIGKVSGILGFEKATKLLKEAIEAFKTTKNKEQPLNK